MGIFKNILNKKQDVEDAEPLENETPSQVVIQNEIEETTDNEERKFIVKFAGKKHRVIAKNEEEAIQKVKNYYNKPDIVNEPFNITIGDIFNAISEEVTRIVTVAHPETVNNDYDRWAAVLTEELGEIVHEINDEHDGKKANKNLYVECVQLCAATTLLAKKFASEHPEMFETK